MTTLTIKNLSHEGRGIAQINGKTIFVDGALPDEEVEIEITHKKKRFDEAKVTNVLIPSSSRIEPRCPYTSLCGGCSLQHMSENAQVAHKQAVLLEQFEHIGQVIPKEVLTPLVGENWGYRRKARLGVRYVLKKEKMLVGFREKGGRYLTDMDHCAILDVRVGLKIKALADMLATLESAKEIPQIEVAAGDDNVALIFRHLVTLSETDQNKLKAFGEKNNLWIYLQPKGANSVHLIYPQQDSEYLSYHLKQFGLHLFFHPTDFTQVNAEINQKMLAQSMDLLSPQKTDVILDLFCGLGNFSLPLATLCRHVIAVEGSEEMVKRGYFNAGKNNIKNVEFHAMNLEDALEDQTWVKPVDKLLLDPPRTGALNIVQNIHLFKPRQILYVSCNSATLARDAGELAKQGYLLKKAGIMDMFPHTKHAESMALFEAS